MVLILWVSAKVGIALAGPPFILALAVHKLLGPLSSGWAVLFSLTITVSWLMLFGFLVQTRKSRRKNR